MTDEDFKNLGITERDLVSVQFNNGEKFACRFKQGLSVEFHLAVADCPSIGNGLSCWGYAKMREVRAMEIIKKNFWDNATDNKCKWWKNL